MGKARGSRTLVWRCLASDEKLTSMLLDDHADDEAAAEAAAAPRTIML